MDLDTHEQQKLHDTAALRALAEGEVMAANLSPHDEDYIGYETEHIDLDNVQSASESTGQAGKKARSVRFTGKQTHSTAIQFRKTSIPLLYVLGAVLWTIGVITFIVVSRTEPGRYEGNPLLENGILFSAISIVLGCFLIAGGAFFHYEVKKSERQNSDR